METDQQVKTRIHGVVIIVAGIGIMMAGNFWLALIGSAVIGLGFLLACPS